MFARKGRLGITLEIKRAWKKKDRREKRLASRLGISLKGQGGRRKTRLVMKLMQVLLEWMRRGHEGKPAQE